MRVLVTMLLVAAMFAGCADVEEPTSTEIEPELPYVAEGLISSHPGYNYLTNAALKEAPEVGVLFEDIDGQRVWYKPAYRGLENVLSGFEPITNQVVEGGGRGIHIFGSLVLAGPNAGPMSIIDISDPAAPKLLAQSDDTPARDLNAILYPDGQLVAIGTNGGSNVVATDITDPSNPVTLSNFDTESSTHNIAVVPGAPIVYSSGMGIIDYTDPNNPVKTGNFPGGDGCHDIEFYINQTAAKVWAICAGYDFSEIWDIQDPFNPVLIKEIPYPSANEGTPFVGDQLPDVGAAPLSFSHLAIINHDASVLIMGDETGGGALNGCDFYAEGPDGQTYSGPYGNLWFYDITDPENPDLRGHVSPSAYEADGSCTAHFGKTIEDLDYVVMGFYAAGVVLVDYTDLDNPRIVDRYDPLDPTGGQADVWDVQFHQGYLFTGDSSRGVDILGLS